MKCFIKKNCYKKFKDELSKLRNKKLHNINKDSKIHRLRKNMIHFDQNSVILNNPIQKLMDKFKLKFRSNYSVGHFIDIQKVRLIKMIFPQNLSKHRTIRKINDILSKLITLLQAIYVRFHKNLMKVNVSHVKM